MNETSIFLAESYNFSRTKFIGNCFQKKKKRNIINSLSKSENQILILKKKIDNI